jgi:hypothetical protein
MKKWCRLSVLVAAAVLCANKISPLEFGVSATPSVFIPLGASSNLFSTPGFGGFINADADFNNLFSAGPEISYFYDSEKSVGTGISFVGLGATGSVFFYPLSRLILRAGLGGGVFGAYKDTTNGYSLYSRAFGEATWRLTPVWNLAVSAGYTNYCEDTLFGSPFIAGMSAGISLQYRIDTAKNNGKADGSFAQDEPVFPLVFGIYEGNQVGTITIKNDETAEIRNIRVTFRAGDYTSSQMLCGTIPLLLKHKTAQVPLMADFSDKIMNFSEQGKFPGEVVVDYELLGAKRSSVLPVTIEVYNRNTLRWTDPSMLAAFVSPNEQQVLEFSKYLVGIARNSLRSGLNRNMQFAMYLYEGTRAAGIQYQQDVNTPYAEYHVDPSKLDSIQYPFQTLSFKSGDSDELGILYAALLESVGIDAIMVPLSKDFIVACSLDMDAQQALGLFNSLDGLLVVDGMAYLPVGMNSIRDGFINAWQSGIAELNAATNAGEDVQYLVLTECWQSYPPVGFNGNGTGIAKPNELIVQHAADLDLARYVTSELGPKIEVLKSKIDKGSASADDYNSLGLLYVRAGMYSDAVKVYQTAADMNSVPAMVNLGNIASLQKDWRTAKLWYEKALQVQSDNKSASAGLDRVNQELKQ